MKAIESIAKIDGHSRETRADEHRESRHFLIILIARMQQVKQIVFKKQG